MSQENPFLFAAGGRGPLQPPPSYQPHAPTQPPPPSTGQDQIPPGAVQQAHVAAFQQNAALPAVPLDVLKGVPPEHVMAIIQALQSGQLTLPPVPTGPLPTGAATAPGTALPLVAPTAPMQPIGKGLQDVDMDKEDGELEEGEEPGAAPEREFLRPPPTGPRKASPYPRERQARAQAGRRASVQTSPRASRADTTSQRLQNGKCGVSPSGAVRKPSTNGTMRSRHSIDSGAAARAFVLQMHNAGYTFEQLAQEIPNKKALTRMYKSLNLPLSTEAAPPPATTTTAPQPLQLESAASPAIALVAKDAPSATLSTPSASLTKRLPPPKPAGPPDRAEYLAKLAAAKNPRVKATAAPAQAPMDVEASAKVAAKSLPAQPPALPQTIQDTQLPPPATPSAAQTSATQPAPVPDILHPSAPSAAHKPATQLSSGKSAIKTELIKQKLEALKAERAAKANAAQLSNDGFIASHAVAASMTAAGNLKRLLDSPISTASSYVATTSAGPQVIPMAAAVIPPQAKSLPMPPPVQPARRIPPLLQPTDSAAPVQPSYSPAAHQTAYLPAPPTPGRSFSSLPGLFMASAPVLPTPSFQQPPLPSHAKPLPKPAPPPSTIVPISITAATAPALPSFAAQRTAPRPALSPYASSPIASPGPLSNLARKRPVAADFDNDQARSAPKRPFSFGQSRSNSESERLVIEVSDDDDDEEDDMDLDPTPVEVYPRGTTNGLPPRPSGSLPGLTTRSNLPFPPPAFGSTVDIAGKDKAIAEMKRKIAEREAQQAQLRGLKANGRLAASANTSGKNTPLVPPPTPLTIDAVAADPGGAVPPSISAGIKSPLSATAERTLSAAGIAREQERMRLQQRFDELKEQMAGREDAVISPSPAPASKQVIPGLDSAGVSYSQELVATGAQNGNGALDSSVEAVREVPLNASHDQTVIHGQDARGLPGLNIPAKDDLVGSQVTTATGTSQADGTMEQAYEEVPSGNDIASGVEANHAPETLREGVVQPVSDAIDLTNEDVDMDVESSEEEGEVDDEDEVEVEDDLDNVRGPAILAQMEAEVAANMNDLLHEQAPAIELDTSSASSTDSEDYELETVAKVNGVHEQARAGELGTSSASSTDSEDHELEARYGAMSEEGEVEDVEEEGEYDPTPAVAGDEERDEDEVEEGEDYEPTISAVRIEAGDANTEPPLAHISRSGGIMQTHKTADDLAPDLQPAQAEQMVDQDEHKIPAQDQNPFRTYYRPYESVLFKFHDYRFHPDYLDTVAGGYKSLTYSHVIDPHTPWCPHEASGGQCNDRACGNQHFRGMGVTDNELLKALTADRTPTSTAEAKARWKAGLTAVFQELRSKGLNKDAKVIAARIVAFRREFVGGGGRVLDLGLD
ncbi:hypothetical protein LTR02_012855 [Friedmanniomyces endolithicus]|nr:hypothetical protein LTR94_016327 [Friedmanniomyces endolithicus]KAK0777251.1 hypothetical protein LTR59_013901 [Friedmanniomyces endolithicus]KAK0782173.1 hypothetical protein LTR38_013469 [Friedmanniomyces endolithicus]KAK0786598.1 hypothetical protein LTR75_013128 [Friedmanniomyces endolithicus]KAK0843957.1 hypothetical protein LTS02_015884 [Friedmanniomyces endolithicus]